METNKLDYANNLYFLCILLFISKISKIKKSLKSHLCFKLNLVQSLAFFCLPINVFTHSIALSCISGNSLRIYCDNIFHKLFTSVVKAFSTTFSIASLLLFLIILANASILNPGPEKIEALNCYFQNVQGFVTLNSISKPFPDLFITKILEFLTYVFANP